MIEAVGPGVSLRVGQHVALSWMPSCGRCEECVRGLTHLCRTAWTGMGHGGLLTRYMAFRFPPYEGKETR